MRVQVVTHRLGDTIPIVRATSLAAHGSLAPVAGGAGEDREGGAGHRGGDQPGEDLRRRPAVAYVIGNSLGVCGGRLGSAPRKRLQRDGSPDADSP